MKIFTSFVSPATFRGYIEQNYLPIFIVRSIKNSELVGHFEGSILHFKEFAPSNELFRAKRDGLIGRKEFKEKYLRELGNQNLLGLVGKLEYLASLANTDKIVLLGYGSKAEECHRILLSDYLLSLGLVTDPIHEIRGTN